MKELLETLDGWRPRTAWASGGRSSCARSAARRGPRGGAARRGRRPARGLRERRLRRGRGVRGDRAGPHATAIAGVIRYGISDEQAWDVGLACGGTIDVLVEPRAGCGGRCGARQRHGTGRRARGRDAAAGRRAAAAFGPTSPGPASRPAPIADRDDDGRLTGTPGDAGADDRAIREAATTRSGAGTSRTVEVGGRQCFIEAYPAPAAAGRRRRRAGRAIPLVRHRARARATRRSSSTAAPRSPRRSASRTWTGSSSAGPTRSPRRSASGRRCGRGAHARRQVRRAGDRDALRRGCRYVGAVGSQKTQADRRERLREAGVTERSWPGCAARSAWTWVAARPPRPRSRSWPRSSRSGTAGQACPCASLRRRSAWSPSPRR